MIIDSDKLLELAQDTERFEALFQWVAMGGSIVICDCGKNFEVVPKVVRSFSDSGSAKFSKTKFYCPTDKSENQKQVLLKRIQMSVPYMLKGKFFTMVNSSHSEIISLPTGKKSPLGRARRVVQSLIQTPNCYYTIMSMGGFTSIRPLMVNFPKSKN